MHDQADPVVLRTTFNGARSLTVAYSTVPRVNASGYAGSGPLGPKDPNPIPPLHTSSATKSWPSWSLAVRVRPWNGISMLATPFAREKNEFPTQKSLGGVDTGRISSVSPSNVIFNEALCINVVPTRTSVTTSPVYTMGAAARFHSMTSAEISTRKYRPKAALVVRLRRFIDVLL